MGILYEAAAFGAVPIGSIVAYGGSSDVAAPAGYMYCHGQVLNASDYPELYDVIGTKFGTGDGSTGSFNLPDMRESVPVGAGQNQTNTIAAHDVYTVGQFKDDQMQPIEGTLPVFNGWGHQQPSLSGPFTSTSNLNSTVNNGTDAGQVIVTFDSKSVTRTGTTTHGKRTGVEYIIKVVK